MISLISSLSPNLYLNSLVYDRNIFGSSSKVFGNLWQSSETFGKCSETFVWPSEQFWKIVGKWSEIFGNNLVPRVFSAREKALGTRLLRKRVKNAVISIRPTPSFRSTAVSDHFLSDNHSPNDMELMPLELLHSSRDALRKAREAYLIERGQTLEPNGINKREEI